MPPSLEPVDSVRVLAESAGFWAVHLCRVTVWVLVAVAALALTIRLSLLVVFQAKLRRRGALVPSRRRLSGQLALAMVSLATSVFLVIRPDAEFLLAQARASVQRGDWASAASYFEPVARWGSREAEVYDGLAFCYIKLGRHRQAIEAFRTAEALGPSRSARHAAWAVAHAALGEAEPALAHLETALRLADTPAQRSAVARELLALRAATRQNPP